MEKMNFKITKDCGKKVLRKVFVKEEVSLPVYYDINDELHNALAVAKTVCVVTESGLNQSLVKMLCNTRAKTGLRIYMLVKEFRPGAWDSLRKNVIIRKVPHIRGNYLLCDTEIVFFFNTDMQGYAIKDKECAKILHDLFVYDFWNNATGEFVDGEKDVVEKTFDVSPVYGNDLVKINRSALEKSPYASLFGKLKSCMVQGRLPDFIKDVVNENVALFFDKMACEENRDWINGTEGKAVYYTDDSIFPICESENSWYILNNHFEDSSNNIGGFFAIKMKGQPSVKDVYHLRDSVTYKEVADKTILRLNDFTSIKIEPVVNEEREFLCDYRLFRDIGRMSGDECEKFFDKQKVFDSNALAVKIDYTMTISVKQVSEKAKQAKVYEEYDNFVKAKNKAVEKLKSNIAEFQKNLKKNANQKLEEENTIFKNNEAMIESLNKIQEEPKTLDTCRNIAGILSDANLLIPSFDLPRYGILYQMGNKYEYAISNENDLESAEAEMEKNGIDCVEFVRANK